MQGSKRSAVRSIGRAPKFFALFYLALAMVSSVAAVTASNFIAVPILMLPTILLTVVSFRVKAWIQGDVLVVRSYWRTRRFDLTKLHPVTTENYAGWWVAQSGSIGLDILVFSQDDSWEIEVRPETVCLSWTARKVAKELSDIAERLQSA